MTGDILWTFWSCALCWCGCNSWLSRLCPSSVQLKKTFYTYKKQKIQIKKNQKKKLKMKFKRKIKIAKRETFSALMFWLKWVFRIKRNFAPGIWNILKWIANLENWKAIKFCSRKFAKKKLEAKIEEIFYSNFCIGITEA